MLVQESPDVYMTKWHDHSVSKCPCFSLEAKSIIHHSLSSDAPHTCVNHPPIYSLLQCHLPSYDIPFRPTSPLLSYVLSCIISFISCLCNSPSLYVLSSYVIPILSMTFCLYFLMSSLFHMLSPLHI